MAERHEGAAGGGRPLLEEDSSGCELTRCPVAPFEDVPSAIFRQIIEHIPDEADRLRLVSISTRDLYDGWRARSHRGRNWALGMREVSRKFLRVGRALATWFGLNL
eukprot:1685945-Amphidinium_carterae.1